MTDEPIYSDADWQSRAAEELGFDAEKLNGVGAGLTEQAGPCGRYRVLVVRGGSIAAEWNAGVGPDEQLNIASARKSLLSCLIGIAVAEGKLPSPDARICEYYPEMLEVPEGAGPKAGRCNKPFSFSASAGGEAGRIIYANDGLST